MKINWINFAANTVYLLCVIFAVYLIAYLLNQEADDLVGWFALGMAAASTMGKVFE